MEDLRRAVDDGSVVALDGGLATTLEAAGHDLTGPLWSARLLQDDPEALAAAHRAFVAAGARVVSTATYQLSAPGLRAIGRRDTDLAPLVDLAVTLAREAGAAAIAGSVGPYGAMLADGSEYRGDYGVDREALRRFHAPRLEALLDSGVDVLACETIPSAEEVAVLAELLAGCGRPAWVSVTLGRDGLHTAEGQELHAARAPAMLVDEVIAVGVNCVPPARAATALAALSGLSRALVVYPNVGARWDAARHVWVDEEVPDPRPWVAAGARLVGGCCGTTPATLRQLLARLPTSGAGGGTGG